MNCRQYRRELDTARHGDMPPRRAAAWKRHGRTCPRCAGLEALDAGLEQVLRGLPRRTAAPDFNQAVWRRLASRPGQRPWVWRPWPVLAGLAAGAAAAVWFMAGPWQAGEPGPAPERSVQAVAETEASSAGAVPAAPLSAAVSQAPPPASAPAGQVPEAVPVEAQQPLRLAAPPPAVTPDWELQSPEPKSQTPPLARRPAGTGEVAEPAGLRGAAAEPSDAEGSYAIQALDFEARLMHNRIRPRQGEEARLEIRLPAPARVRARIFDRQGRLVQRLHDGRLAAGVHVLAWDGGTAAGTTAASGIYFMVVDGDVPEKRYKIAVIK